jgi:hypothetical protein
LHGEMMASESIGRFCYARIKVLPGVQV